MLNFECERLSGDGHARTEHVTLEPSCLVVAGWTGRDVHAIEHHIAELERLGVPRPSTFPLYYRASRALPTQDDAIEALGPDSSGEAEPVLFFAAGEWWLTVGSDHTDRRVESYSVAVSKQMCAKPVARHAWRWADVAARQDGIALRSRILEDGHWVAYQEGTLASIRPLETLRDGWLRGRAPVPGTFVSCGTLGALPNAAGIGIRPAAQMEIELDDPVLGRRIVHRYGVETLPVVA